MLKFKIHKNKLLIKISLILLCTYIIFFGISITITGIFFATLSHYKDYLIQYITKKSGYVLNIADIYTKFNDQYLPELLLKNVNIINSKNYNEKIHLEQIELTLSYATIWHLTPIFNTIKIKNTKIAIEYLADNTLLINGICLNCNTHKNNTSTHFDIEDWLLKQKNIYLQNIQLSFLDKKNNFPLITLPNINVHTNNNIFGKHSINFHLITNNDNLFETELEWYGNKFENYKHWKQATFTINIFTDRNLLFNKFSRYLPEFSPSLKYSAKSNIIAKMQNGVLNNITAKFDIKNFSYKFHNQKKLINFPNIGGNFVVNLDKSTNTYNINANNLNIQTESGYLLNNKQINGFYEINKKGELNFFDTNLTALNTIIKLFPFINKINMTGNLSRTQFNWQGNIFHPTNYNIKINFNDIGIKSQEQLIPNFNNLSGNALIGKESGNITIALKNSVFTYDYLFYIPININTLTSTINWTKNTKDHSINFNIMPTIIDARDFYIQTNGLYIYTPNTSGFLKLDAKLNSLSAKKVGYYLPKQIDSANKWLQKAIIDGYAKNATLKLNGFLDRFPFEKNDGIFYIDSDFINGKLEYVKNWPTIDNANGKFMIRNKKIIIQSNHAQIINNTIKNASVIIPNMMANNIVLMADGSAYGVTQNFIKFLQNTPLNNILGKFPQNISTKGTGNVEIKLNIPLNNPQVTKVNGKYQFINNEASFKLPIPKLKKINGNLFFTNKGIFTDDISANTLGSKILITANSTNDGTINFILNLSKLDYNDALALYLPSLAPFVYGFAQTNILFQINHSGIKSLKLTSNLHNVAINAPLPLYKEQNNNKLFNFEMNYLNNKKYHLNFNYDNLLLGDALIDKAGNISNANIDFGKPEYHQLNLPLAIRITTNMKTFYFTEWLHSIKSAQIVHTKHNNNIQKQKNSSIIKYPSPIGISLHTNNFIINQTNFGYTYASSYITATKTLFNLNTNIMNGYGIFTTSNNNDMLYLYLYYLNLSRLFNLHSIQTSNNQLQGMTIESIDTVNLKKTFIYNRMLAKQKILENPIKSDFIDLQATVKNVYYEGNNIGTIKLHLFPKIRSLGIESSSFSDQFTTIEFKGTNYCISCKNSYQLVDFFMNLTTKNLGYTLDNIKLKGILEKGSGKINTETQWHGNFTDFNITRANSIIDVDIANGKFLKVNTGNLLGSIIGVISLQSIVNIANLNFKSIFSNGYTFDTLKAKAYFYYNQLNIKFLYMSSTLATVGLRGTINLNNREMNLLLSITPHVGIGVAVGAAIVTVNPLVGVATYVAELLLKDPVNKLFAFSFSITGNIKKPQITQLSAAKQVQENIDSTIK